MFVPQDFVELATALQSEKADGPMERRFRTAISRAYYAVYLTVRQHIRAARKDPSYDVEHQRLARWLADHEDQEVGHFGTEFCMLLKRRTESDYHLHVAIGIGAETMSVLSAKSLISKAPAVVGKVPAASCPARYSGA